MEKLEGMGFDPLEYLDIGGGFPSKNALHGIYLPPEQSVPDLEEYAEAICSAYKRHGGFRARAGLPLPELVFECGRAAVDDAVTLIASVAARKPLPSGAAGIVLDAGVNVLFTAFWYSHAVKAVGKPRGAPQETVLYGPMCMNIDVVRASVQLPPLEPGDLVAISPAGAYNNTQWMQFIEYRPAIVMVCEDGKVETIREAENLDSMCLHDRVPARLSNPCLSSAESDIEKKTLDVDDLVFIKAGP
jgi:diaminopimelate decarboxylase